MKDEKKDVKSLAVDNVGYIVSVGAGVLALGVGFVWGFLVGRYDC